MRVMMIVKGDSEPGEMPTDESLDTMTAYNEELMKAGMMRDAMGLHPSAEGARVKFDDGKRTVTRGPFAHPEELIAGFWLLDVDSMDEAIEWAKKVPFDSPEMRPSIGPAEIEIRPVMEMEDFGEGPAAERARRLEEQLMKTE